MGIALIKKINEKTPYCLKKPFSKIIRAKLIKNKIFLETYKLLEQGELMTLGEKEEWQLKRVKELLTYAYAHTSYYHDLFDKIRFEPDKVEKLTDIQKIPILEKKTLIEKLDEIASDDIPDYYTVTTGGSTGEPVRAFMEKNAIYKEWAFVYHYWSKFGYDFSSSKLATFRGVDMGTKICEENPLYAEIRMNPFLMNQENIKEYICQMERFGADFIYGYPSAVYNFCRLAEKQGLQLKHKFKAALLISENLYPFQEELITRVLGCKIAMFYGHSERAVFAEKYESGYQFNPFYGVTEINDNDEPIVTGFINGKTLLIRYLVDDKAELQEKGNYKITGHWDSAELYGANGERVSIAAINFHDDTFERITGFQFVQNQAGVFVLRITADEKLDSSRLRKITERVSNKVGAGFKCTVEQVDKLEMTPRNKYKMLIQNYCKKET